MYNSIQPHYDDDDIWERKKQYYDQVTNSNGRRMSPHRVIKLEPIPQPGSFVNNQSKVSQGNLSRANYVNDNRVYPTNDRIIDQYTIPNINISQINPKPQQQKIPFYSSVSQSLKQTDPQRYKLLQQRAQLYKKLQLVTVGLPIKQNTQQTQLLSNNYIMPHYKSEKITELKAQQQKIKKLTVEMLQNEKLISRISSTKQGLVQRIDRIRKIDKQIYKNLDEDKNQQVENYLRIAKNLLAQGESEDKITAVLKKILY